MTDRRKGYIQKAQIVSQSLFTLVNMTMEKSAKFLLILTKRGIVKAMMNNFAIAISLVYNTEFLLRST